MYVCRNGDCKGCPVEGTPYTPSGQFRPVMLNACKCTMSARAARLSAEAKKCKLCFKALKTDVAFTEDEKACSSFSPNCKDKSDVFLLQSILDLFHSVLA